eukprot:CCRYP_004696-RA/>CCRYP_004696-RA protein AED:0.12 eAED:0.23 QI:926/1/0.5/1/0/0/2/0/94
MKDEGSISAVARMRSHPPPLTVFSLLLLFTILVLLHDPLRAQVSANCTTKFSRLQVMRANLLLFGLSLLGLVEACAPCFGTGRFFLSFAFECLL